jgi:hypothetical protein
MRLTGSLLMAVGVFCLIAAILAVFGPTLRANGADVFGSVTSVKGVATTGALLLVLGASLRRVAQKTGNKDQGSGIRG